MNNLSASRKSCASTTNYNQSANYYQEKRRKSSNSFGSSAWKSSEKNGLMNRLQDGIK